MTIHDPDQYSSSPVDLKTQYKVEIFNSNLVFMFQ
jgi:hypothetical protein